MILLKRILNSFILSISCMAIALSLDFLICLAIAIVEKVS